MKVQHDFFRSSNFLILILSIIQIINILQTCLLKTQVFQTNRSTEIYFDISNTSQAIQYETKNIDGKILLQIEGYTQYNISGQQYFQPTYKELIQYYSYDACKEFQENETTLCVTTDQQESLTYQLLQQSTISQLKVKNIETQTIFIIYITIQYNNGSNIQKEIKTDKTYYYDDQLKLAIDLTYYPPNQYQNVYNILYDLDIDANKIIDINKIFSIPLQQEDIQAETYQNEGEYTSTTSYCTQFPLDYKNWKLRNKLNQNTIEGNYVTLPPNGQCNYSDSQQVDQLYFYRKNPLFKQNEILYIDIINLENIDNNINNTAIIVKQQVSDVHLHLSLQTQNAQIIKIQQKTDVSGKLLKIGDNNYILKIIRNVKDQQCDQNLEDNTNQSCDEYSNQMPIKEKQIKIQYQTQELLLDSFTFEQKEQKQIKYFTIGQIDYNNNQMKYLTYKYDQQDIYVEIDCKEKQLQFNQTFSSNDCDINYHKQINEQCFSYCENDTYFREYSCQQKVCQSYKPYFNIENNSCILTPQNNQNYQLYQTVPPMELQCVNGQYTSINGFKTCECNEGYQTTIVQNGIRYMCTINKVINKTDYPDASIGFVSGDDSIFSKFMDKFTPAQQSLLTILAICILFVLCLSILSLIAKCFVPKSKSKSRDCSNIKLQLV